ncbi:hypothetical protein PBAC_31880 [Pedobacter glucosidilyticus]|nr:hypothetical protein [Pedobacter glucosidilyticus]KHJ36634.1 hypothetical protein PBAC_31880 [Pedobacter glucosidilyticus]
MLWVFFGTGEDFGFIMDDGSIWHPPLDEIVVTAETVEAITNAYPEFVPEDPFAEPEIIFDEFVDWIARQDLPPSVPNPCDQAAQAAGAAATNLYASSAAATVNNFVPFSNTSGQNEQSFRIQDYGSQGIIPGPIETLGPNGGTTGNSEYTKARVHTHPFGTDPAPSAADIFNIGSSNSAFNGMYTDSYIVAADGTKYNLHVSDPTQLAAFMAANGNFYDASTYNFIPGTSLGDAYFSAKASFKDNNNLNDAEANARALATVLQDSGIILSKAAANSNEFKKIGTEQVLRNNGQPKKDANGNSIYKNSDCP